MRVTKMMKQYAEDEFSKKRIALNKQGRSAFESRKAECVKELELLFNTTVNAANVILKKYDMDVINDDTYHDPIAFYPTYVQNKKELDTLYDEERVRYNLQKQKLDRFYLECDLGCDREQFFKMVENLNFD